MSEAVTVTSEPRRCAGTTASGQPCGVGPELVLDDGYCFTHSPRPGQAERLRAAGTLGGLKTGARMRKGIDVGALTSPEDAARIVARLVVAIAGGELPAAQGRAALEAVKLWLRAYETDVLDKKLDAWDAAQQGGR